MNKLKTKLRVIISQLFGKDFSQIPQDLISKVQIISFDVFDTLIIREGVKYPDEAFDFVHPENSYFKQQRLFAEKQARSEANERGEEEIKLSNIYDFLPQYDEQDEIDVEIELCRANKKALGFYESIRKDVQYREKRIIIITDIYLSKDTISSILTKCGYDICGIPIYVSSEIGLTKKSGNLFRKVIEMEKLMEHNEEWLHIGDNLVSDYINAKKIGLKAFLYHYRGE